MGEPLIVKTPPLNEPLTPPGKPLTVAPVAVPPIAYVIVVIAVLMQAVWTFVPTAEVRVIVGCVTVMISKCVNIFFS